MERQKLKARIIEKYGSIGAFVEKYGTTYQTVGNVVRGTVTPSGFSLAGWLAALDIPEDEAYIFFPKSLENQTG